jgi:MYXO-CTERM domain-containing protein
MMRPKYLLFAAVAATGFAAASARAGAPGGTLIDFNGLPAGTVVNDQFAGQGVRISVQRTSPGPAVATLYNTRRTGEPDPDLQIPFAGGNLGTNGPGGNILIIPENNTDKNKDGLIDQPNDEGDRPAGQFTFNFTRPVSTFGFDLIDIDGPAEFNKNAGYFASFYLNGSLEARVGFGSFIDPTSPFYDPTVKYGDNTANRIRPISAREVGMPSFDRVVLNFGGSGGTDNIIFTPAVVPEPGALALLGLAVPALLRRRRA